MVLHRSQRGEELHVDTFAADDLVTAQQPFVLVAGRLSGTDGGDAPGLDVQLDAVDVRYRPCQRGQRGQGVAG